LLKQKPNFGPQNLNNFQSFAEQYFGR
jgi:hypothetical protein